MGGPGSGNVWQSGRPTCEAAKRIDIRYLRKHGMLKPGYRGSLHWSLGDEPTGSIGFEIHKCALELTYRIKHCDDRHENVRESIHFGWTDQPLGGHRRWFICPKCGRNCAVLYGGGYFRCRKCYGLVYATQREDAHARLCAKARKLRKRLDDYDEVCGPLPEKPKGMHWRTYNRLIDQLDEVEERADQAFAYHAAQLLGLL